MTQLDRLVASELNELEAALRNDGYAPGDAHDQARALFHHLLFDAAVWDWHAAADAIRVAAANVGGSHADDQGAADVV